MMLKISRSPITLPGPLDIHIRAYPNIELVQLASLNALQPRLIMMFWLSIIVVHQASGVREVH